MATTDTPGISMAREEEDDDEATEMLYGKRGGGVCCFCIPSSSLWWEKIRTTTDSGGEEHRWWKKGLAPLMKIREWSEIIAGPKWKTFIRRFNKNSRGGGGGGGGTGCLGGSGSGGGKSGRFQYDPLSYALNFDQGPGQGDHSDEEYVYPDFSSRYAAIPGSGKASSMDLGKDGPGFV